MLERLASCLKGRVVVLGIGNALRRDDAAGSLLARRISARSPFIVYDAGTSPENYLGKIVKDKPDNIVIIDAAEFGGTPGEYRLVEGDDVRTTNMFSTHNASISLSVNFLHNSLQTNIAVLLIQPRDIAFGETLSPEVSSALDELEKLFTGPVS